MEDRRMTGLSVGRGETRQFLLEAGSMVMVVSGEVNIGQTTGWLCGQAVRVSQRLVGEDVWVAESGGWVDIVGNRSSELAVIPPDRISFWCKAGACLESWIARVRTRQRSAG